MNMHNSKLWKYSLPLLLFGIIACTISPLANMQEQMITPSNNKTKESSNQKALDPIPSLTPKVQNGFIQFYYVSTTNLPFLIYENDGQTILSGGGDVNCVANAENATAEQHGTLDLKGTVTSPNKDYPQGHLEVHLKGSWTEEIEVEKGLFPLVITKDIDIPIDFNYLDGTKGVPRMTLNAEDYAFVLFLGHLTNEAGQQ
jgi:hypothetical protein